jgi:TonB-dependent starch-binding outer membrane protein SusC
MENALLKKLVNINYLQRLALIMVLTLLPAMSLMAQKTLSGIVKSATDDQPLIGVNISVKGLQNAGTVTDFDGKYSLQVSEGQTIVFSYIGYTNKEIKYSGQSVLNVTMNENSKTLDEVVVIG